MILYKTNQNWLGDVSHLFKSWTMTRIVRAVGIMGVYSLVACLVIEKMNWGEYVQLNTSIFSLLGVILSIFLVFRTNSAYDRWWEARKQWGALVNNTRNFAIYVDSMYPEEEEDTRHWMASHVSNFCIALVDHLREGTELDKLIFLPKEEREVYEKKDHIPNYISQQIFKKIAADHREGTINEGDYINIKIQHQSFLDILGACERIKKTPIPFSYAVYLKIFISAYALLLPFALVTSFHMMAVPLAMFLFFALLGVELLGEEIEDPFGLDCNDLPTGDIAHTIKKNVFEILENRKPIATHERELYEKVF
ncbi:bestrophin family protein [Lewinella cohaerens]|uniref:bestrophin family protein n=1 Tax=Lewinella cohaerens TaxID=70995 RepID=UPI000367BBAC|nr:bestrophin family protein [Lewinella cohaerens]